MEEKGEVDFFNKCLVKEKEIAKKTASLLKRDRESEFYKRSFNLLNGVTRHLYYLTKSNKHSKIRSSHGKGAILSMMPRLIGTIQSIRILV